MDEIQVLEGQDAEAAIERLNRVVTLAASEEGSPDVAILKQDGFVAAPVIHKGTLSEAVLEKIFAAAKTTEHSSMTAMGLYSPEEYHCYEVPMSMDALNELRGTSCGVINFALFASTPDGAPDGTPEWLVLFDDQLYVAYGSKDFVTALVGDIDDAYKAIEDRLNQLYEDAQGDIPGYARQEINRMGEYLDAAYSKLTNGYAKADVGERVFVL